MLRALKSFRITAYCDGQPETVKTIEENLFSTLNKVKAYTENIPDSEWALFLEGRHKLEPTSGKLKCPTKLEWEFNSSGDTYNMVCRKFDDFEEYNLTTYYMD